MGPRQGRRWLRFSLSPRPPLPPRAVSSQRFPMHESIEPWVGAHRTATMAAPPALRQTGLRGWRGMGGLVGLGEVGKGFTKLIKVLEVRFVYGCLVGITCPARTS